MVTILFVDIVGSTSLYERLGNAVAKRLVTTCLNLLRKEIRGHSGEVVQAIGDELMCRFPSAELACAAAIAMQQQIAQPAADFPVTVKVRIGLQYGEALREGNNLYGDAVNTAARLSHVAQGGQIMTSQDVIQKAGKIVSDRWRQIGLLRLKGKELPMAVCEIIWEAPDLAGLQEATIITRLPSSPQPLYLAFGDLEIRWGPDKGPITLGRDKDCDLVIPYPQASRHHATIEYRMGKHYLIDHSANGTTMAGPDQTPLVLHREEAPLAGSGQILCGFTHELENTQAPVRYSTRGS